ncbi:sensor histidine kinase [Luethyella okanaganae]|uniref:histidine kinase n=1 Tax=Luethyella okanaganae TaxID=69372 RepID=A0ABW1VG04_9MICO
MHQTLTEHWNRISLRTKITGVTVLMLTLGLLVSGIGTMTMLQAYVLMQMDARLQTVAQSQSTLEQLVPMTCSPPRSTGNEVPSDYFVAVYNAQGNFCNRNWGSVPIDHLPQLEFAPDLTSANALNGAVLSRHDQATGSEFHVVLVPVSLEHGIELGTALVAVNLSETKKTLTTYLSIFLGFGVAVVILGALITRMLVTSTFGPLRKVEHMAAAIADGDFSQRLGGATPNTEVGRLNRSLNTMLNRIDRAFRDRARTIDQMRRFVGDASHELRTPLVSVRGYAELYRMGALQTPDEVAQAMGRIEKEAIRMGGLVEDLLELARLDETKPLALTPVDLVPLARDAALDAMASSPGRVVTVITTAPTAPTAPVDTGEVEPLTTVPNPVERIGPGATATGPITFAGTIARLRSRRPKRTDAVVPESTTVTTQHRDAAPAVVLAEENKIRQVLTNLLGNAMRFTSDDSPIEIGVSVDRNADRASIEVIDHGEGIPPQIREKIFQRFWRADTSRTRETGGSGLGLAIVSSIVAAHNGTVDVVETPGGGATFRVNLPLAYSASAPQSVIAAE